MANLLATVAALIAVALFGLGLLAMTVSDFRAAGFSFLAASLVIFVRESRLVDS